MSFFLSNFVGIYREKHSHPSQISRSKDPKSNSQWKPPVQALNRRMHRAPVPFLLLFIIDAKRFIIDTDRWPELFSVNQKKKQKRKKAMIREFEI